MKDIYKFMLASALFGSVALCLNAGTYGYCSDVAARTNIFRLGSTELQGMAIRLDHDKIAMLKGASVTGVDVVFGSSRATAGTTRIFVKADLDSASAAEQAITIGAATRWQSYAFDSPYVITGDEECLYIGYTGEISTNATMLHADYSKDSEGTSYVYKDGKWVDSYGLGFGNASIRVKADGAAPFTDVMLKPLSLGGYFKAGTDYTLAAQVYNFGEIPVTSFDVNVAIGDDAPVTIKYDGQSIAQGACFDIRLPDFASAADGVMPMHVEVVNVNGTADSAPSDNVFERDVYFYPANMERNILLEGFTGQDCHNCPGGHSIIRAFIEGAVTTPVIEVMHHAGYQPDFFTMDADVDFTYMYGGTSTYAPAVMLNRVTVPSIGFVPVMGVSAANLQAAYNAIENAQPYASLGLESTYDAATRQVNVKLSGLVHADMPTGNVLFNLFLVQDGIVSLQVPYGAGYEHNAVFRGTLTGNSWGIALDPPQIVAGGTFEWTDAFTLPEGIFSDYAGYANLDDALKQIYTIPTDPSKMRIVAFVGAYGDTPLDYTVYNAVSVPLGESHVQGGIVGIDDVVSDSEPQVNVCVDGGRIYVYGDYDSVAVYDAQGRQADIRSSLRPGIYIVLVASDDATAARKVVIR